jgi:hypothetical protein
MCEVLSLGMWVIVDNIDQQCIGGVVVVGKTYCLLVEGVVMMNRRCIHGRHIGTVKNVREHVRF